MTSSTLQTPPMSASATRRAWRLRERGGRRGRHQRGDRRRGPVALGLPAQSGRDAPPRARWTRGGRGGPGRRRRAARGRENGRRGRGGDRGSGPLAKERRVSVAGARGRASHCGRARSAAGARGRAWDRPRAARPRAGRQAEASSGDMRPRLAEAPARVQAGRRGCSGRPCRRAAQSTASPGALSSSRSVPPCSRATAAARLRPRPKPGASARSPAARSAPARARDPPRECRGRGRRRDHRPGRPRRAALDRDRLGGAPSADAPYFSALSTRLASAWPISSRLPCTGRAPSTDTREGDARLLGQRLVELGDAARHLGRVEAPPWSRAHCPPPAARSSAAR